MGTSVCLHVKSKKHIFFLIFRRKININRSSKIFLPHPSGLLVNTPDTPTHTCTRVCSGDPCPKARECLDPSPWWGGWCCLSLSCRRSATPHATPPASAKAPAPPTPARVLSSVQSKAPEPAAGDGQADRGEAREASVRTTPCQTLLGLSHPQKPWRPPTRARVWKFLKGGWCWRK